MEKFICTKNGKVGYFKDEVRAGQEFPVVRNIENECVLIVAGDRSPNIIASEGELRRLGTLTGTPSFGGM